MDIYRLQFFALAYLLKTFSDRDSIRRLEVIYKERSKPQKRNELLLGYKLAIETLLYRQLEMTIESPQILGLELDNDLYNWWRDSESRTRKEFNVVIREDTPNSTPIVNYIHDLLVQIVQCGTVWHRFTLAAKDVSQFSHTVLSLTEHYRINARRSNLEYQVQDIEQALRLCGAESLYDDFFAMDGDYINRAFDYTHPGLATWEDGNILEDFEMFELRTSRDVIGIRQTDRRSSSEHLAPGIYVGAAMALHRMGIVDRLIYCGEDQLPSENDLFGTMLEKFRKGHYPSVEYGLIERSEIPREKLEPLMLTISSAKDPLERLRDSFSNTAYLASSLSSNAEFHCEVLLRGILAMGSAAKEVDVLQIEHTGRPNEIHPPVSLAIRVRSDWQVFYNIDAAGRMGSPVWRILDRLGITPEKVEGVSTQQLLSLCDRPFQYVSTRLKKQKDLNSHLRGELPELLATLLLVYSGFNPVRKSLELSGIGEFDAVGFSGSDGGGECKIIEVRRAPKNQIRLQAEIEDFARKLGQVRSDPSPLEKKLGCPGPIHRAPGLFITMADVGEITVGESKGTDTHLGIFDSSQALADFGAFLDNLHDIDFWDCNRFRNELLAAGLPDLPVRLLEDTTMVWEVTDYFTGKVDDVWDTLSKAVRDADWRWPGSEDALMTTLRDTSSEVQEA